MKNEKLLVGIINSFTKKQLFFGLWIFIVSFFVYLMYRFYKKSTQRNFKDQQDFPARARPGVGLANAESDKSVTHKNEK